MGGREEPPDGVPEGAPGGDDEFRSVVFDESFVRAARIQELSASERLGSTAQGVRTRSTRPLASLPRQAFALMLLIAMAFAAAVYMGIRHPYREPPVAKSRLTMNIVPLAPAVPAVPGRDGSRRGSAAAADDDPFAALEKSAGTTFYDGSVGLVPPPAVATRHFSVEQVSRALAAVQQYLVASSLDSKVLVEGSTGAVRDQLSPGQRAQFDDSVGNPRDDLHHAATGWLVRFDPAQVTLGVSKVKVSGGMTVDEADDDTLEVITDHTFVYALQAAPQDGTPSADRASAATAPTGTATASTAPTGTATASTATTASPGTASPDTGSPGTASPGTGSPGTTASPGSASPSDDAGTDFDPEQLSVPGAPVTLFAVRRELRFQFDRADIDASQLQLVDSVVQAGPMACDAHTERYLRPILADRVTASEGPQASGSPSADGRQSTAPAAGIDPLDRLHRPAWQLCGVLSGPMASLSAR
ncbi:hypothetical protein [Peterkaempfera sp. SMS 1(5)a]|uniref:SCO2583 family membrane protein n=1 Tax=Peterkaempfera podocarpi TaxID=3232308 RepID=UPI00366DA8AB